jgi:hypothetical protein
MKIPEIDEAAFSGPLGEIVNALDPFTEGSRVGVLTSLLAGFSAYLGKGTKVQNGRGRSPLSFWPVLVGVTGQGRKGTATGMAMQVIEHAFKAWSESNVLPACPVTGLGFVSELAERGDDEGNARPTLIVEEEMDGFISNAKKDMRIGQYLRKTWDGSDLRHKTGNSDISVKNVHVSIIGHVQPKNWGAISGSKDATGGTYNRFFPVAVERSKIIPVFGGPDPTDTIREQASRLRRIASWAREVDLVTVSQETAQVFEEHHRPACEALIMGNEELAQMCERAMAYLVRIAALYALLSEREGILKEDFDAALALVTYSVETVVNVLPEAGDERLAARILAAVERYGPCTANDLWDAVGHGVPRREINAALLMLPQVRQYKGKSTGGRRPILFELDENYDNEMEEAAV